MIFFTFIVYSVKHTVYINLKGEGEKISKIGVLGKGKTEKEQEERISLPFYLLISGSCPITFFLACHSVPTDTFQPPMKISGIFCPPHILDYFLPLLEDRAYVSHFGCSSVCCRPWQVTQVLIIIPNICGILSSRSWWWTGKPGMLQSMGSQRIGHDWVT